MRGGRKVIIEPHRHQGRDVSYETHQCFSLYNVSLVPWTTCRPHAQGFCPRVSVMALSPSWGVSGDTVPLQCHVHQIQRAAMA